MSENLPRSLAFKDTFVKLLVQTMTGCDDTNPILFPDNTTPVKIIFELNQNEFTRILSALYTGADLSYPDDAHEIVWSFLRNLECPVSICDELIECLSPLFETLQTSIDALQDSIDAVRQTQESNGAQNRPADQSEIPDEVCGGATAVVDAMNFENEKTYQDTENSLIDNVFEFIPQFIEAVPILGSLPFDELFELANAYFEAQYTDYLTDFIAIRDQLICDLACFIHGAGDVFGYDDAWNTWLVFVGEGYADNTSPYYNNRAARIFARYAPAAQAFGNQVAAFFNVDASLQSYFDTLNTAYTGGLASPEDCSSCGCPNCDDEFTITIGTDNLPTSIISVVMQVTPLGTELPPDYWCRRIVLTAPAPVARWEFDYNYGGGATGDPLTYSFGGVVAELPEQTGHAILNTSTPSDTLTIDLGYSGSPTAYDDSPMFLAGVTWCD